MTSCPRGLGVVDVSRSGVQATNAQASFGPFARAILAHIAEHYGCTSTDLLMVAAAWAPTFLDSERTPLFGSTPFYVRPSPLLSFLQCPP